jgi:argininosuccinate lyase
LTEDLGAAGAKIHTGRSRNDQVVTDLRLFAVDALTFLMQDVRALIALLTQLAESHATTLLAGTTHFQPAQPITLGFYLLSLAHALCRDHDRLENARARTNLCPLGSGALAGSAFAVDREALAKALGFDGVCPNALDAVSDRDFAQEIAGALAILGSHLSRFAEQFVLWANPAFGYIRFADDWSTGSSMMPQKRNPDAMELVRAKAARLIGQTVTLLTLTKGLVPSYSKDLQEDKAALFDMLDTARLAVQVFHRALQTASFDTVKMRSALSADLLATEIADALTQTGIPFRQAHERVGGFVRHLEADGRGLSAMTEAEWQHAFPELLDSSLARDFTAAVERRAVLGGTAPAETRRQCIALNDWLSKNSE